MQHPLSTSVADRRVKVRYLCKGGPCHCAVEDAEKEERWPARVHDISAGDMGLLAGRRFEVGTRLEAEAELAGRPAPLLIPMRVVRVERTEEGRWFHGCVFEDELPEADVRAFLRDR